MSYITEIGKRKLELVKEAVDWLSYPVRISIDKGGEIHVALSVRMGDPAHYSLRTRKPEDPVVEFTGMLVPDAKSVSITFDSLNVIDEVKIESRDDCLVIHNKRGAPSLDICTLMESLQVDGGVVSRTFRRIDRGRVEQICLTRPRDKWTLLQRE